MTTLTTSLLHPGLLVAVILLVHASFQAGVSALTLLSGHSLKKRKAQRRLLHLNTAYISGVFGLTALLVIAFQALTRILPNNTTAIWVAIALLSLIVGVAIAKTYYRRGKGTVLWIPRQLALLISTRAQKTKDPVEAFSLGMLTVVAELPLSATLFAAIGLLSSSLDQPYQLGVAAVYAITVSLPLIVITVMISGGHRLSTIQRWRENNKSFLQYSAGAGMILIALYIVTFYLVGGAA